MVRTTGLNGPQHEAVMHRGGPLLVLAGAGSGKTRVITYRIATLLDEGVPPQRILGVTFTNKAAREMRERLRGLVGAPAREVALLTFHALGLEILKQEVEVAGLKPGFCIYDTSDQLSLVRELMRQVKVADRRLDVNKVLDVILRTKRERRDEVALEWGDDYEMAAYDLYPRYVEQMAAFNAVDFDDLLLRAMDVLEDPEVRDRWANRFDQLLVDEYQDTSPQQLQMLQILAGKKKNICVVGDDDQSIYAWRGAVVDNILTFGRTFSGCREVILDQNYRSTNHILRAANDVIQNNAKRKTKVLWSDGGDGAPVEVVRCADPDQEATFVAESIVDLHKSRGLPYESMAVLYRANTQARVLEEALRLERIPYRVVGGQSFYDRKDVRDAVAFLSVAQNPRDGVSLRRIANVPPRGIGPASLQRLVQYAEARHVPLWRAFEQADQVPDLPARTVQGAKRLVQVVRGAGQQFRCSGPGDSPRIAEQMIENLGLKDAILASDDPPPVTSKRLEGLQEVVSGLQFAERKVAPGDSVLATFLRSCALDRSDEKDDEASGLVTLMTLHSVKGLEFPYVWMVGVEEELLPHSRSLEAGGELSEERRLCYVGMTRARQQLWMTHCAARTRYGSAQPVTPSRFLQELGEGKEPDPEHVKRWCLATRANEEQVDSAAAMKALRAQLGFMDDD